MRTPSGIECPFFYGDYYRGRNFEECRLIGGGPLAKIWTSALCADCPVPGIKRANSCEFMKLTPSIKGKFLVFGKKMKVTAFCTKSNSTVATPHVGCGLCHPLSESLTKIKIK